MAAGWAAEFWKAASTGQRTDGTHVGTACNRPEPVGLAQAKQEAGHEGSARRLWAAIRGPYPAPTEWDVPHDQPAAPLWPNLFSDGSVQG
eukprot:12162425-Alexandrium_andersonii.AAC.1